MPDFTAAIGLLKKPFEEAYQAASGKLQEKIGQLKTQTRIRELHRRLWESQRVKTIWHTDRPLSLSSFFYPVSVRYVANGASSSTKLTSLDELPDLHTIIYGTVGQGKSILLRYLLGREIRSSKRVPLLGELRNVGSQSLAAYLSERFSALLGLSLEIQIFDFFAKNGRITFLLDGFDEIEPASVPKIMQELEDLSAKYELCRIVLTSRPNSECKHLTSFHSVEITPLQSSDLEPFYRRITRGESDYAKKLVAAIETSPTKIKQLVVTPLLATLLAISYRAAQKIPVEFSEFYEELFQILLIRHDGSKKGWRRPRKTNLNDREIQQAFEAFSFATRRRQLAVMESDVLFALAESSLQSAGLSTSPTAFVADIKQITCLLVDEGKNTTFVHSSVPEFFAARYIKTRPEGVAQNIYGKLLQKWPSWSEEILFLQQIDSHRSKKYFFIPDINATLMYFTGGQVFNLVSPAQISRYLGDLSVKKTVTLRDGSPRVGYSLLRTRRINTYHLQAIDSRAFRLLFQTPTPESPNWAVGFVADASSMERTYEQIANDRGPAFREQLFKLLSASIGDLSKTGRRMAAEVAAEEETSGFADLD